MVAGKMSTQVKQKSLSFEGDDGIAIDRDGGRVFPEPGGSI